MSDSTDHNLHPYWVIVTTSKGRRYVFGYKTKEEAEKEVKRRQRVEDERVKEANIVRNQRNRQRKKLGLEELPDVVRFEFSIIKRPAGGWLG